ncbi:enoyl-CoA hydratase/isomerase family protein [Myxococcus landrumensis]|uniref:Enoyl-CoA hydratase/isomerase family protein n=1 Tax=Myxococcus landrumensis TaxID=2813577 RepID=A0ABX7N4Q4_9BACT|nr:enoyl-CoA hydratase-related protein [Myxococcus landrumus]QSQ13695.1 enoyl-CoA hydratase/isomerase family protein [Myxococcus landrumus]
MEPSLDVEDREGGVRVLTLSNPARRNALNDALLARLDAALEPAAHVRVLLVRGAGGTFCAGYDLTHLGPPGADGRLPDDALVECLLKLERHPVPSVALVQGAAVGAGFDLAASCDFRVGAPDALFLMPPAKLGIVYSPEGLARATRLVGLSRAKQLFLTARKLDAREALSWGLLDMCEDDAEARAFALCATLAGHAPGAVSGMKESFGLLSRAPLGDEAQARLRALRAKAFGSEDAKEGREAFLEKRPPRFTGR